MSSVRNPEDLITAVVELQAKLADLESTLTNRISRRPTGDVEPTMRATPKPNTIFLKGQALFRADYPILLQFAIDNSLFVPGGFSVLDGVTTFGLPDWQGKTIIGTSVGVAVGADVGSNTKFITISNMPAHGHGDFTFPDGDHGGHRSATAGINNAGGGFVVVANADGFSGNHTHDILSDGGGTAFNVQQASKAVNWMIYT
jgi:hypothetical protein